MESNNSIPLDASPIPDNGINQQQSRPMPIINPPDLMWRTFLMPINEDGQRLRAKIVKAIDDHEE